MILFLVLCKVLMRVIDLYVKERSLLLFLMRGILLLGISFIWERCLLQCFLATLSIILILLIILFLIWLDFRFIRTRSLHRFLIAANVFLSVPSNASTIFWSLTLINERLRFLVCVIENFCDQLLLWSHSLLLRVSTFTKIRTLQAYIAVAQFWYLQRVVYIGLGVYWSHNTN